MCRAWLTGSAEKLLWLHAALPSFRRRRIIRGLDREGIGAPHCQHHPWGDGDEPCGVVDDEVSLSAHQDFVRDLPVGPFVCVHRCELEQKTISSVLLGLSFLPQCPCFQRQNRSEERSLHIRSFLEAWLQVIWFRRNPSRKDFFFSFSYKSDKILVLEDCLYFNLLKERRGKL